MIDIIFFENKELLVYILCGVEEEIVYVVNVQEKVVQLLQFDIFVFNYFVFNIYMCQMDVKVGMLMVIKMYKIEYFFIILKGSVLVLDNGELVYFEVL